MEEQESRLAKVATVVNQSIEEMISMPKDPDIQIGNQFKDIILSEIGEVPISSTQKIRVLIVLDKDTSVRTISAQKWWREKREDDWIAGKGFKLNKQRGVSFANLILQACDNL